MWSPDLRRLSSGLLALILVLLVAGCDGQSSETGHVAASEETPTPEHAVGTAAPSFAASPAATRATPATPSASPVALHPRLTPEQLKRYQPDELGYIPVLEYHAITTDPAQEAQFIRLADHFRADLQWLYDHDFYVITMARFVRNEIAAPAGKHPVVLTFDDAQSSQFLFVRDRRGQLVPDPNTAVGILEGFFEKHPDFGRGGFFAILPDNCFAVPDHEDQMNSCDRKLQWLVAHGYEVGNHTRGHQDLLDVTNAEFKRQIAENILWLDEHAPHNLGTVLAMPYGNYPDEETHKAQWEMMRHGFTYKGRTYKLEGALKVGAEPAFSPSSEIWDPLRISRIQAANDVLAFWFDKFASGDVILYTSDGNPETVTIPNPVPELIRQEINPDLIHRSGKALIRYVPPGWTPRRGEPARTDAVVNAPARWACTGRALPRAIDRRLGDPRYIAAD